MAVPSRVRSSPCSFAENSQGIRFFQSLCALSLAGVTVTSSRAFASNSIPKPGLSGTFTMPRSIVIPPTPTRSGVTRWWARPTAYPKNVRSDTAHARCAVAVVVIRLAATSSTSHWNPSTSASEKGVGCAVVTTRVYGSSPC
jgi:hypothetical protein